MLGRLTRLICFDRHNRFNHHDFRVMAVATSAIWAFFVNLTSNSGNFRIARHSFQSSAKKRFLTASFAGMSGPEKPASGWRLGSSAIKGKARARRASA
jgi:hypothetical protein